MGDLWEFVEAAWEYWGSAVIALSLAVFIWVINYLYEQGSGSEGLPWYISVLIALLFSPFIGYRIWLDERRARRKEVQNLKESHQQAEETLHQQIITLKDQLDIRAHRKEQRETLARYLTRGRELINIYASPEDVPREPRDEWAYGIAQYLQTSFDESYFARWNDSTGIASHYLLDKEVSKENELSLRDIHWRILRLRELTADLKGYE